VEPDGDAPRASHLHQRDGGRLAAGDLATPVAVTANTTYVASYHTTVGHYAGDNDYFATTGVTTGPLSALATGVDGSNGCTVQREQRVPEPDLPLE